MYDVLMKFIMSSLPNDVQNIHWMLIWMTCRLINNFRSHEISITNRFDGWIQMVKIWHRFGYYLWPVKYSKSLLFCLLHGDKCQKCDAKQNDFHYRQLLSFHNLFISVCLFLGNPLLYSPANYSMAPINRYGSLKPMGSVTPSFKQILYN